MIKLHRLNQSEFFVNPSLIEIIEETPDTVITLTNEKKFIVSEKTTEIINRIIEYNRKIFNEKNRIE